ncbi:MAG: amino acid synthesis family protein [Burkholderiaceae bacterium]
MKLEIHRWLYHIDQTQAGDDPGPVLRKAAIVAVLKNPYAGKNVNDLTELIQASESVGQAMACAVQSTMRGYEIQSYGKGGVVGLLGEQEHANALLTTTFANPVREAVGGAKAWIPSMTKRATPGSTIDVPLAHKDALYVRSHYDGVTLTLHDIPAPDEVALIIAVANRGRIHSRVGGLHVDDIHGQDGLT